DEKRTWRNTKVVTPQRNQTDATFTAEKVKERIKIIISVAPPGGTLLRTGGDYEIEASGAVQFDEVKSAADPIVRTYQPKVSYAVYELCTTRLIADGAMETAKGQA